MIPSILSSPVMITVLALSLFQAAVSAETFYVDPDGSPPVAPSLFLFEGTYHDDEGSSVVDQDSSAADRMGTKADPYKQWSDVTFKSGNKYLQKSGTVSRGGINVEGVSNVTIGVYGEGPRPLLDGQNTVDNGISLVSTRNVIVSGFAIRRYSGSCITIVGSADYLVEKNTCEQVKYGISVNAGKFGPRGRIIGNEIRDTTGDGIGAWSLSPGAIIMDNQVYRFGNDGIDILGSTNAVISGNNVHDSFDVMDMGSRGTTHAGIKAGGNRGEGGGNNQIIGNTVRAVKNYGIYNRSAVGNVYIDNLCEGNGVNFNFVNPENPSYAHIEGNISRKPSYAAGLEYGVFIPHTGELSHADSNQWYDSVINVKGLGLISDQEDYRNKMYPNEIGTVISTGE